MLPPPSLAGLYADADAALYTTFLALDPVLGLDAAIGAQPRRHHLP
jgi:hypothetical protein